MGRIDYFYNEQTDLEWILCHQSNLSYPLHNHASVFTIGIVLDGAVRLTINGGTRICRTGELFAVPPYAPHRIQAQTCYTLLSLCVDKQLDSLKPLKRNLACLLESTLPQQDIDCHRIWELLDCLRLLSPPLPADDASHIGALRRRLEAAPEIKLSIGEMAEASFASKSHFIRTFKREVGLPPHQFQIQNRIRKAQKLLHGTASIAEVASTTGFFDQSHFIRHFEKIVGLTPTDYKNSCRAGPLIPAG